MKIDATLSSIVYAPYKVIRWVVWGGRKISTYVMMTAKKVAVIIYNKIFKKVSDKSFLAGDLSEFYPDSRY